MGSPRMARKMSRKAKAAALRNLAKARRARKRKHTTHVKSPGRKRRVSQAQRAAARRNIKKAIAGKRRKKACRKAAGRRGAAKRAGRRAPAMPKHCKPKRKKGRRRVKSSGGGKRKSAKRVAAGKKAARTRKRHKAERAAASRKGKRRHGKRRSGKRKAHRRSGKRKSAKRVRAGRKAARTRRHHKVVDHQATHATPGSDAYYSMERGKRRKKRRKGRRRNPVAAIVRAANPVRRRHRRRNPLNPFIRNPIQGPGEFIAGLFGVGMGYVAANLVDRLLATHPLAVSGGTYVDSPPAGQIYDSEAPLTPIWTSPIRFIAGVGMIFVPGVLSRFAPGNTLKAFLQLASYGAAAQVAGKAISDGIATFAPSNPLVLQAYGGEVAAQAKLAAVGGGYPSAPPGFSGPPRGRTRQLGAPAKVGCGGGCGQPNCGGNCSQTIGTDPVADAQNAQSSGQPFFSTTLDSGNLNWQSDPAVDPNNGPDDCAPAPVTPPTYNTMPGGTVAPVVPPPTQLPPVAPAQPPTPVCGPGQVWNAAIGQCVTPHAPTAGQTIPGIAANAPPVPTSQTVPVRTVTPSTAPVTAVPHIIA